MAICVAGTTTAADVWGGDTCLDSNVALLGNVRGWVLSQKVLSESDDTLIIGNISRGYLNRGLIYPSCLWV